MLAEDPARSGAIRGVSFRPTLARRVEIDDLVFLLEDTEVKPPATWFAFQDPDFSLRAIGTINQS
jgi:hypothetical protein